MFLPRESQGRGSLVGCHLWGRMESDTTEATQQPQQQYKIIQLLKVRTRTQGLGYSSKMIPFLKIKGAKSVFFNLNDNDMCAYLVAQSCLTLCDPKDCSLPGSSVHGILQARILEWVAMPSSWGSSPPRYLTQVSHIAGGSFTV